MCLPVIRIRSQLQLTEFPILYPNPFIVFNLPSIMRYSFRLFEQTVRSRASLFTFFCSYHHVSNWWIMQRVSGSDNQSFREIISQMWLGQLLRVSSHPLFEIRRGQRKRCSGQPKDWDEKAYKILCVSSLFRLPGCGSKNE